MLAAQLIFFKNDQKNYMLIYYKKRAKFSYATQTVRKAVVRGQGKKRNQKQIQKRLATEKEKLVSGHLQMHSFFEGQVFLAKNKKNFSWMN